jgi:V/A-type H+-transporting ATPase subunit I
MGGTAALDATVGLNPQVVKYLYYGFGGLGGLLVFILNDIKRNPLINVGAGLWDSYNMATGLLGDVLSYVRLFALSISGSVMGFVFNDLAIKLSGDIPVVSPIIMIIIMLFGHGINIFMSALGAFVHPLRLTFVEFYKNAGFEGGGKKYNPFASIHK